MDAKTDDYFNTMVTVFEPDVERDGEEYDYLEYLTSYYYNEEIDLIKEPSNAKAVMGQSLASAITTESSNNSIHQTASKINPSEQKTSGKVSQPSEFSLSSTQESDGARAKANANRSRSKTYTRAEAAAIMNAVAEGSTDAEGNPIRIKGQKGKIIDALWERLNQVDENSEKHMKCPSRTLNLNLRPSQKLFDAELAQIQTILQAK